MENEKKWEKNHTKSWLGGLGIRNCLNPRRSVFLNIIKEDLAVHHGLWRMICCLFINLKLEILFNKFCFFDKYADHEMKEILSLVLLFF